MKQEISNSENKATAVSQSPAPAARFRASRTKESPRGGSANGVSPSGLKTRPKPAAPEPSTAQRSVRSLLLNRLKPGSDDVGSPKGRELEDTKNSGRPGSRAVEQFARARRRPDMNCKGTDGKAEELQTRLDASELLARELQSEVLVLKAEMEKLQNRNVELESQNKHLAESLSAAEAKIMTREKRNQESEASQDVHQPTEFRDVRKLLAARLDHFKTKKEVARENGNGIAIAKTRSSAPESGDKFVETKPKVTPTLALDAPMTAPPPPPPPPPPAPPRGGMMQKDSALVQLYHTLTKRDGMKDSSTANRASTAANNVHNSIVGELQNRSAHLLAIKGDVETKRDFIKYLIERVQAAAYRNMDDVLKFVDWLDQELSTLADERAVLKHFNWPERKADALREAAFEYRDLKRLETEAYSYQDDASLPCEASLKKIECTLDKLERSIQRMIKLRSTSMQSYRECKIPTDWMLDSGMISKMKLASVKLAKVYINRLSTELESLRHSEREALLFQGVRFAYRAHQFAGGLDPQTMHAFEEMRERVQAQGKGSNELITSIRVS